MTYFLQATSKTCIFTPSYTIYVANKLPPNSAPLIAHCQSKDDDLGNHTIAVGQNYNWSFCENAAGNTLFFCHLYWGSKQAVFDVFSDPELANKCSKNVCYWEAQSGGIFFNGYYPPKGLEKMYDWNGTKPSA